MTDWGWWYKGDLEGNVRWSISDCREVICKIEDQQPTQTKKEIVI